MSARMQGMTEAGYQANVFDTYAVTGAVKRLKADGVNWLAIQVAWYQPTNTSDTILPSPTKTPTDASVTQLIRIAHENGMRVFLNPFVNALTGSGWQALFHPTDVNAWFASYDAYLAHYAALAQADHADLFAIGDEFDSMDTNPALTADWDHAISIVRKYYTGPITYGANYTNYQKVTFWNELDYVGIDAYFPLSRSADPTVAQLAAAWNADADQIQAWRVASGLTSKPLLITELGYPSETSAAANPGGWEPAQPVDLGLQQKLYQATFESIWQRPWLAGIMWFWWANPSNPDWTGGPGDNGYTLRNKPAETTLRHWFTATPAASSAGAPSTGTATTPTTPILVGLAPGSPTTHVDVLQGDLRLLGWTGVAVNGSFDAATSAAVSQFERWTGLTVTTPTTLAFRNAVLAQLQGPKPLITGLYPGEAGAAVWTLQADLALLGYTVPATGVYDGATRAAVTSLEARMHLPPGSLITMAVRDAILAALNGRA